MEVFDRNGPVYTQKWFPNHVFLPKPSSYLVLFHAAGCDASMFLTRYIERRSVGNQLLDQCETGNVQVFTPVLPGRSHNHSTPMGQHTVESLTRIIFSCISKKATASGLGSKPVYLVGHSMGCFFAYEFAKLFINAYRRCPTYMCLSAAVAPTLPLEKRPWAAQVNLSDEELRVSMLDWDMNPTALTPRMWEAFCPIVRMDMKLVDEYASDALKFDCNGMKVVLIRGAEDRKISRNLIEEWIHCFPSARCEYHEVISGTHGLYHSCASRKECFEVIVKELRASTEEENVEVYGF